MLTLNHLLAPVPAQRHETITAAFESAAIKHRQRTSLGAGSWQPKYEELNATANRMAHGLLRRGDAPADRVAIIMEHDTPIVAAILAGLKAGKIIVTLNPAHPPARLSQLLTDAEPTFLVADRPHRELAATIAPSGCRILNFDEEVSEGPAYNPSLPMGPDESAFLAYTSGTTGPPKGVINTHRQRLHGVSIHTAAMGYTADDRIPLFASLGTGQGIDLMLCGLLNGARLYPFPMSARGTTGLRAWMLDQEITVYSSSASIFRHFMKTLDEDVRFPLVQAVRLSSESATSSDFALFQRHFPKQCKFVHMLASSETAHLSVYSCTASDEVPAGRIGIGIPANGNELFLLDENGHPVEPGEVGEIVVRSRYLAAGYWRQPALTAERFSSDGDGVRQFRTGDLARRNSEGLLKYVGRTDSRVKIRGNRVGLPEVEDAIEKLHGVERAVVDSFERENHEHALTGYVVVQSGYSWSQATLRTALRSLVPDYMVPSAFVLLDSFPTTSNGKIDREKLRQLCPLRHPIRTHSTGGDHRNRIQEMLLALWRDVLKRQDIGCDDNFFLRGGDSLAAVDLLHRIEDELQYQLPLTLLMEAPTVRQLESRILHSRKTQSSLGATTNVIRINTAGQQRPLFSLCGRYGHAVRLLPVLHSLGPDQPCYALQPPAMDWTSVGCTTLQEIATHYIGEMKALQPCGPYRLLGTSFGGLVTFEMALQLQRSGEQVEFLGMVDTFPPTCVFEDAIDVGNSKRLKEPPARPNSIEARNQRVAESHLRARRKYVLDGRSNQSLFGGELTYFYCTGNPVIAGIDRRRLWERFARGFLLVPVPGLHGAFNREPQSTALQNLLRERLNGHARISSDPTAVFGREYRLENGAQQETIVSSTGKSYQIENSCRQGNVETARIGAQKITIAGWAVEHCLKQPAQNIVVFCGDKLLGYGASGIQRPEVAERLGAASAEHAGFFFRFERHLMEAECGQLRVFVLSSDGHATELGLMATASLRAKAKRTKRQARCETPSAE